MSLREIPPDEWPVFLEGFSRDHRAWLASVDRLGPDAERHVEVAERPLDGITALAPGREIRIRFQADPGAATTVRVEAPARLRVDETAEGADPTLEIDDEEGGRTRLRFRIPTPPGLLDGVVAGEL